MERGKWLLAEAAVAAAAPAEVVFVPAAAVVAQLGVLRSVGLSAPAGCSAPGDSGGAWPH